jgi:hypothetical protein
VGVFNTPHHQYIGHQNKKINKEILELNDTIDQYFIQERHNILSSQQPVELSPK